MNGNIPSKAGRNLLVFLVTFTVLYAIFTGAGVGPFQEEEREGLRSYHEFLSLKIPSEWVVPPFIFVSSILIAWLDSRRIWRKEAVEIQGRPIRG